jgi:hypothetical protein
MTHEVFISYSNRDKPIADGICANLEAAGVRCWIAPRDIAPGENWPAAISKAISQSQIMVLVFSSHSNNSEDVSRELILAANRKLVIIPFRIEDVTPKPGMEYYLARTHWLDAMNPPTRKEIQKLVETVKKLLVPEAPNVVPVTPVTPASTEKAGQSVITKRLKPRIIWIIIPLFVFVIVAIGAGGAVLGKNLLAAKIPMLTNTPIPTNTPTPTNSPPLTNTPLPTTYIPNTSYVFNKIYINDAFNDNSNKWSVGDFEGNYWVGNRLIENGVFDWNGTARQEAFYVDTPGQADLQVNIADLQVSTRVNLTDPNPVEGYGLILRAKDDSNFYTYMIEIGQFSFFLLRNNVWITLIDWKYLPTNLTINGWNKMMVQAIGNHFRLFYNDNLLAEIEDASLSSGQSGVIVQASSTGDKIQVQFDDFEVCLP